jgi:DNA-binding IclR family transcriptional regulator
MEHSAATVEKALDVLFHLHERPEPWGVSDLGRALNLPKSSVHRLLVSLRRRGLVESDERGRYRPGIGLLALGLGVLDREPLVAAARPVLEAEAKALDETFFVVASRAGALTVLDKVEGTGFLRAAPRVGSIIPAHLTAVGRLYLAHAPDALRSLRVPRSPSTASQTGGSRAARGRGPAEVPAVDERELALVRRRGYAENLGGWIEGLSVFAAPVLLQNRLLGAIATALPTPGLSRVDKKTVVESVVRAANTVSGRLAGREI